MLLVFAKALAVDEGSTIMRLGVISFLFFFDWVNQLFIQNIVIIIFCLKL